MAKTNLHKRREIRKLEARRDDLQIKKSKTAQELAQIRAALKQRRTQQ